MNETSTQNKLAFTVYRGDNNQVANPYYFTTDADGKPEKVGDGTYGVVFSVKDVDGAPYVVKIFYETLTTPQLKPLKLTEKNIREIEALVKTYVVKDISHEEIIKKLRAVMEAQGERPFESIGEFVLTLTDLGLPKDYLQLIVNQFQSGSTPLEQFNRERKASAMMRKTLKDGEILRVVNVEGSTESFKDKSNPIFETLRDKFADIDISNYALIMKRYQYTLKDILENPVTEAPLIREDEKLLALNLLEVAKECNRKKFENREQLTQFLKTQYKLSKENLALLESLIYRPNGYSVLQSMTFTERIRTILPFLRQIAEGINTIHSAKQYHFDLKPDNILVNNIDGVPEVVVGDLGSIHQREVDEYTETIGSDEGPFLGTRHYRSPEQKDFFDICYAKVSHREQRVILEITDRKFTDTIIEQGDQVVFSKSDSSIRYEIAEIKPGATSDVLSEITLDPNTRLEKLKEDPKTQVILYKKQSARTDLFGLGAIAYDLITYGNSPERFYENIRHQDKKDGNIDKILEDYRRLTLMRGSTDPTIRSIFAPFIQNREYAPLAFVEFILKCMLYQAKGTYFNPNGDLKTAKEREAIYDYAYAIKSALAAIVDLVDKFKPDAINRFWGGSGNKYASDDDTYVSRELHRLQTMSSQTKFPERLAVGMALFNRIFALISKEVNRLYPSNQARFQTASDFSFAEMLPEFINRGDVNTEDIKRGDINSGVGFTVKEYTYESLSSYLDDLKEDYFYSKINTDPLNPFVPYHFVALRRVLKSQERKGIPDNFRQYSFVDASPLGNMIEEGDWVVCNSTLWKVDNVHETFANCVSLKIVPKERGLIKILK